MAAAKAASSGRCQPETAAHCCVCHTCLGHSGDRHGATDGGQHGLNEHRVDLSLPAPTFAARPANGDTAGAERGAPADQGAGQTSPDSTVTLIQSPLAN